MSSPDVAMFQPQFASARVSTPAKLPQTKVELRAACSKLTDELCELQRIHLRSVAHADMLRATLLNALTEIEALSKGRGDLLRRVVALEVRASDDC